MNIFDNLYRTFRQGNSVTHLILINSIVFILLNIFMGIFKLFNISADFILPYLAAPADLVQIAHRFWTPITYMFLHEGFLHILFNMINLFWFGKIFLIFFSEKKLVGLYLLGGLMGVLFYVLAFNIFPFYSNSLHNSLLLGASGSIMAIIVASAMRSPNMEMQLMFIGAIKLKYIAAAVVLMSLFGITSNNGGGQIAHLGGALAGYLFVVSLQKGTDITKGINWFLDTIFNLFRVRKLKVKPNKNNVKMSDAEFNMNKARKSMQIDQILDKIKTSGYESLSADEKKRLFEQGNKN